MASPSELSLDCRPHSHSMLLKSFGEQHYAAAAAASHDHTQKLEEFLSQLEEERLKIDAFKRELPLCMQLLTTALETSRQQLQQAYGANHGPRPPVLEEFIPLKNTSSEDKASSNDKANWMTTAQLWSQDSNNISNENKPRTTLLTYSKESDVGFNVGPKLALDTKQRNGGAFLPFSKERNLCPNPTLALASNNENKEILLEDNKCSKTENGFSCPKRESLSSVKIEHGKGTDNSSSDGQATDTVNANTTTTTTTANNTSTSQTHRKARRCWSPELHRRFVNALQMLGGSQVATPKQIRELMKVDGLTNDEVKSHLQKYRLHTRRPCPSPQTAGAPAPRLVVLGGIWVPPEYATAAAAHGGGPAAALYGAHPASHAPPPPHHFCAPSVPQDFYTAAAAPPIPLPQSYSGLHHHPFHIYKATSQGQSSPESDVRGTENRSESIEDGKSDSSSENISGGERKGLAAPREDGEESNGSEIRLTF